MKNWFKLLTKPDTPIIQVLEIIESGALQVALVIDDNRKLLGIVTDGDIRRGILKGISLDEPVRKVMNRNPIIGTPMDTQANLLALMKSKKLHHIPILDNKGIVVDIQVLDELIKGDEKDNWVIIMAGGLGTRLRPLTENCPKPLLRIGNKPILENILESYIEYGFKRFFICVNYLAEMVEEYFGDGSRLGVSVEYVREEQRMGTTGALSLLEEMPSKPIIVMNGDLLTKVNFNQLLDFHLDNEARATMCVREYQIQIPYGVVNAEKHKFIGIKEKPVQSVFVNAGIYVLNPEILKLIPRDRPYDMPELFMKLADMGMNTVVFPIREYWLDIGSIEDFNKANGDFIYTGGNN